MVICLTRAALTTAAILDAAGLPPAATALTASGPRIDACGYHVTGVLDGTVRVRILARRVGRPSPDGERMEMHRAAGEALTAMGWSVSEVEGALPVWVARPPVPVWVVVRPVVAERS